jgi:hypothetical protein
MTLSAAPTPARVVTKRPQGERLNLRIPRKAVTLSAETLAGAADSTEVEL